MIQNCRSNQLRRRSLREPTKGLEDILNMGRILEQSDKHASAMEGPDKTVNQVSHKTRGRSNRGKIRGRGSVSGRQLYANQIPERGRKDTPMSRGQPNTCRNCGYEYPHKTSTCPAKGKTCNFCKKVNHFSRCCHQRNKPVREVLQSDSEDEFSYSITNKDC